MRFLSYYIRVTLCLFSLGITGSAFGQFVTTWQTDNPGVSANNQIIIRTAGLTNNYDVYWEEVGNPTNNGSLSNLSGISETITFPTPGTYRIEISGNLTWFGWPFSTNDNQKILTVEQWGLNTWEDMYGMFRGCTNLVVNASDNPDFTNVTRTRAMFEGASSFNSDISSWNVSSITDMIDMFAGATSFNQPLNTWDVSNVELMTGMFYQATNFNQPLDNWNTGQLQDATNMFREAASFNQYINSWNTASLLSTSSMFQNASSFNQDLNFWNMSQVLSTTAMFWGAGDFNGNISNWNVSQVVNMSSMFRDAAAFNTDISSWNTVSVLDMSAMFSGASSFNQDIGGWSVGEVTDMTIMFSGASLFNQDLNDWNVEKVTSMAAMFFNASSFNSPLNKWDVASVTEFYSMFEGATIFNQDISSWNTSSATDMSFMFADASDYNQRLDSWNTSNVLDMSFMFNNASSLNQTLGTWDVQMVTFMDNMLDGTNLSSNNYDATLIGWEALPGLQTGVTLGATGLNYCTASAERAALVAVSSWTINDAGADCTPAPNAPTNLFTIDISNTQIDLQWSDNSSDELSFTVTRSETDLVSPVTIATLGPNATTYTDLNVKPETGYFYQVTANGSVADSGPSNFKFGSTITPSGYALATDGDDYVQVSDDLDFQFGTGDFTIEAWIYYDGTDKAAAIVGKRNPAPPFEQIQLRIGTGLNQPAGKQVEAYVLPDTRAGGPVENAEDRIVTDPTDLTIGWHHVAMVEDYDTDLRLYVDGVQVGIDTDDHLGKPMNAIGQDLYIGSFGGGAHFIGIIDEVRIWNSARTSSEIANNMNATFVGNEPNLVASYRLDQGIPNGDNTLPPVTFVPDRSVNNHNGTATNFTLNGDISNWVRSVATPRPFITIWQTDNPGTSADNEIRIPTSGAGYNYDIYWEEVGNPGNNGTEPPGQTGGYTFAVPSAGTYKVEISGDFPRIVFNDMGDKDKILSVEQWGSIQWSTFIAAFKGCENLHINAFDAPDLSAVTELSDMFRDAIVMNEDISFWDVSNVTNMFGMFRNADAFNQSLEAWDVSNVTNMGYMFFSAGAFNKGVTSWDVGNVTNMNLMFASANAFNQDIGGWDVSNVTNTNQMFSIATAFNQDIGGWDIGSVTNIASMFSSASAFNQDITGWNISGISNMTNLFRFATSFDQNISGWDVSGVTDMEGMFEGAIAFTADITGWTVDNVTSMRDMFASNTTFNQNISGWNVSSVVDMNGMFEDATAFNQPIGAWVTTNLNDTRNMFDGADAFDQNLGGWDLNTTNLMVNMFNNSGMSVANYDLTLVGWESQTLQNNVSFGASNVFYCTASVERQNIIDNFGWTINDGGQACINVFEGSTTSDPQIANGQVTPIDVGSAAFGGTRTQSITVENNLAVDLTTLSILVTGSSFTPLAVPVGITTGSNIVVSIELGGAVGQFTETVSITAAEFSDPFEFPITGEVTAGPEPEIAVYDGSAITSTVIIDGQVPPINFGSEERPFDITIPITVENKGSAALAISDITFGDPVYSVTETFPISVPVDGTYTIFVTLDGAVSGSYTSQMTIVSNDSDEDMFDFTVVGGIQGPDIRVFDGPDRFFPEVSNGQVLPIDFGAASEGTDIVRQVSITNYGPVLLDISNLSISGPKFGTNEAPSFTIAPVIDGVYTTVTFDITLDGSIPGLFTETVTINSDDDAKPVFTFDLVGTIEGNSPPPHIYWTENLGDGIGGDDEIHRTDLNATNKSFHRYYQGFSAEIAGLEMDTANNRIYWTDAARAEIIYGELGTDGLSSGPTVILDFNPGSASDLEDLALDEPNGHLYFTHGNAETGFANKIARVNTDGTGYVELLDLGFEEPFGIDLDLTNNKVYFTTNILGTGLDARLYRMNLDGSGLEELVYENTNFPYKYYRDVKIDPVNEVVYFSAGVEDTPGGEIFYNDINEIPPFASPASFSFPGEPRGIDIDLFNNKLYWVCRGANNGATRPMIMRSNLDGSTIENIFTMALYPQNYPPGPPGSAHLALDLRGLTVATTPEVNVFVGPDNTGTALVTGQASAVNLGSTLLGTDLTQSFTIENTGTADLVISGSSVNGPSFSISGADGTISPGSTVTFDVVLSAAAVGNFTDAVSMTTNDFDEGTFTFPVSGDVLAASTGEINLFLGNDNTGTSISDGQAGAIDFGSAIIGTDIDRTFAIENTGLADLSITGITFSDPSFTLVGTAPTSIAIGTTAIFTVRLSGASAGTFSGSLTIANDDPDEGAFTFDLTGIILPNLSPEIGLFIGTTTSGLELLDDQATVVDLGAGPVGTDLTQSITVENTGTGDLILSNYTSTLASFTLEGAFPITIGAGATETLTVRLAGTNAGVFSADISLLNNDSDEATFTLPVTGLLQLAEIVLYAGNDNNAATINNDSTQVVDLGSEPQFSMFSVSFAIENTGDGDLLISSITSSDPVFSITDFPSSVMPGEFLEITLVVETSTPGNYTSIITIVSNVGNYQFSVLAEVEPIGEFEIYNAVSPNGDGLHDFLNIQGIEAYPDNEFYLYNKNGSLVFNVADYNNSQSSNRFEGMGTEGSNGELPNGTYYYLLDLKNGEDPKKGYILLSR